MLLRNNLSRKLLSVFAVLLLTQAIYASDKTVDVTVGKTPTGVGFGHLTKPVHKLTLNLNAPDGRKLIKSSVVNGGGVIWTSKNNNQRGSTHTYEIITQAGDANGKFEDAGHVALFTGTLTKGKKAAGGMGPGGAGGFQVGVTEVDITVAGVKAESEAFGDTQNNAGSYGTSIALNATKDIKVTVKTYVAGTLYMAKNFPTLTMTSPAGQPWTPYRDGTLKNLRSHKITAPKTKGQMKEVDLTLTLTAVARGTSTVRIWFVPDGVKVSYSETPSLSPVSEDRLLVTISGIAIVNPKITLAETTETIAFKIKKPSDNPRGMAKADWSWAVVYEPANVGVRLTRYNLKWDFTGTSEETGITYKNKYDEDFYYIGSPFRFALNLDRGGIYNFITGHLKWIKMQEDLAAVAARETAATNNQNAQDAEEQARKVFQDTHGLPSDYLNWNMMQVYRYRSTVKGKALLSGYMDDVFTTKNTSGTVTLSVSYRLYQEGPVEDFSAALSGANRTQVPVGYLYQFPSNSDRGRPRRRPATASHRKGKPAIFDTPPAAEATVSCTFFFTQFSILNQDYFIVALLSEPKLTSSP